MTSSAPEPTAPEPSPTELLAAAVAEARRGRDEGGVPIGAALVVTVPAQGGVRSTPVGTGREMWVSRGGHPCPPSRAHT